MFGEHINMVVIIYGSLFYEKCDFAIFQKLIFSLLVESQLLDHPASL